jgi:hypothetical protein
MNILKMQLVSVWNCWVLCCIPMSIVSIVRLAALINNAKISLSSSFYPTSLINIIDDFPSIQTTNTIPGKNDSVRSSLSPFLYNNNNNNNNNSQSGNSWQSNMLRDDDTFTGYRYVQNLVWNVPKKVSWSANRDLYQLWSVLPLPPNHTIEWEHIVPTLQYAIIRDPLERLYSGYYNKCIKSPYYEDHCTMFPPKYREQHPPTFLQFLSRNYQTDRFRTMLRNPHYRPISLMYPNLKEMDYVLDMDSPNFNHNMSTLWKRFGANHSEVDKQFPTTVQRKLSSYHSGTTSLTIEKQFQNCTTLQLAMMVAIGDYQGPFVNTYFPTPDWVLHKLQKCKDQGIK